MNQTQVQPESIIVRDNDVPPAVGRIVDYVLSASDSPVAAGEVRPAIIVALGHGGGCFLSVFTRGGTDQMQPVHMVPNALHFEGGDEAQLAGTWHWPPPRELVFKHVPVMVPPPSEEVPTEAPPPDSEPYHVGHPPTAFAKVPDETPTQDPLPFPESKP